ncbi:LacI family transcriptional regulator [Enterobacter cloacae]|uniref:LacI family transcriptional regulator n=1 Tax=Enterobacter cloacae TaxID=550 RepID=A0A377LT40_ENTCL|nr:LacI family transcriptional regulator [Enterobacter cloacae]
MLNDNGIEVPGEISLIGFDDVLVSRYVRPRLTTVRYPLSPWPRRRPSWR